MAVWALGAQPVAGALDFRSDWETARTGEAPPAPWEGLEYGGTFDGTPPPAEQLAIVDAPVRSGRRAARFTVRPGDRYGQSTGERALVRWLGSAERDGDDLVYGWSTLFPPDWRQPPGWGLITEWHADSRFPLAPVRLNAGADALTLSLSTGTCPTPYGCAVQRNVPLLSTLSRGRWNDLVVRIAWRTRPTGVVQVWHRVEGEAAFRLVLDLRGVPTLPWREGERPATIYLLHGLYRDAGPGPSTVYHDGFVRGDSVEEVMAAFPDVAPGPRSPERVVDATCDTCAVDVAERADGLRVTARGEGAADDVDTAYVRLPVAPVGPRGVTVRAALSVLADGRVAGPLTVLALQDAGGRSLAEAIVDRAGFLDLVVPAAGPGAVTRAASTGAFVGRAGRERPVALALDRAGAASLLVDGVVRARLDPAASGPAPPVAHAAVGLVRDDGSDGLEAPLVLLARVGVEEGAVDGQAGGASPPLPDPFTDVRGITCPRCRLEGEGGALVAVAPAAGGLS
ncbi:MAG: polysaccharide lyase [Thermoleophilia bacterium]